MCFKIGIVKKGDLRLPSDDSLTKYTVYRIRWLILGIFVLYSASNSVQWTQYSIIQDAVVKYYGVSTSFVYWTTMVYMITYIPFIFPASWFMDKMVSLYKWNHTDCLRHVHDGQSLKL